MPRNIISLAPLVGPGGRNIIPRHSWDYVTPPWNYVTGVREKGAFLRKMRQNGAKSVKIGALETAARRDWREQAPQRGARWKDILVYLSKYDVVSKHSFPEFGFACKAAYTSLR